MNLQTLCYPCKTIRKVVGITTGFPLDKLGVIPYKPVKFPKLEKIHRHGLCPVGSVNAGSRFQITVIGVALALNKNNVNGKGNLCLSLARPENRK